MFLLQCLKLSFFEPRFYLCYTNLGIPNQLMLHTNSGSNYDRYQAFSELESVDFVTEKDWDDDFGEFQSHISNNLPALLNPSSFIEESVPDSEICKRASKVVACCRQLVHRVFNLLVVNHDEMKVNEALKTERGKNFILGKVVCRPKVSWNMLGKFLLCKDYSFLLRFG